MVPNLKSTTLALLERRRRLAYRDANRLIVSAGMVLASTGISPYAQEMRAIRYALREVNRAGGLVEESKSPKTLAKEAV
jgi:hypothetical protein